MTFVCKEREKESERARERGVHRLISFLFSYKAVFAVGKGQLQLGKLCMSVYVFVHLEHTHWLRPCKQHNCANHRQY